MQPTIVAKGTGPHESIKITAATTCTNNKGRKGKENRTSSQVRPEEKKTKTKNKLVTVRHRGDKSSSHRAQGVPTSSNLKSISHILPPAQGLDEGVWETPLGSRGGRANTKAVARIKGWVKPSQFQGAPHCRDETVPGEDLAILVEEEGSWRGATPHHVVQDRRDWAQRATGDPQEH